MEKSERAERDLPAGTRIDYSGPPRLGLKYYLFGLDGGVELAIESRVYQLGERECLHYQLSGPSTCEILARDRVRGNDR